MTRLQLWIAGDPAAQGSKAYKGHRPSKKTGKLVPLLVEQSKAVTPWRNAVQGAAAQHLFSEYRGTWKPIDGPVAVEVTFYLARPRTVDRDLPTVPPDVDKLQRALYDGLSDAKVWKDDARVITVLAGKAYAEAPAYPRRPYKGPGAAVTITPLPTGLDLTGWLDAIVALEAAGITPWQAKRIATAASPLSTPEPRLPDPGWK